MSSNDQKNVYVSLIVIVLMTLGIGAGSVASAADARERAEAACATYSAQNGKHCSVERCPCGRGESRIGKFDRSGLKIALCACSNGSDLVAPETQQCTSDAECDDGRFCNGPERCDADRIGANANGCVITRPPCNGLVCFEESDSCAVECVDLDIDGVTAVHCGGSDCDDADANRYPGNPEICDDRGHDEDCDPATVGWKDDDGDGFISASCR